MKKNESYLKLCNNPFKEKAEKLEKRAIVVSIIIAGVVLVIALLILFASIS